MREIKFRAWNFPTKQMFYWPSIQEIVSTPRMVFHDRRNFEPDCNHFMQYTGLHDKNRKEIYEGDVVKVDVRGVNLPVTWSDWYAAFGLSEEDDWSHLDSHSASISVEVIGNIYETPELLQ